MGWRRPNLLRLRELRARGARPVGAVRARAPRPRRTARGAPARALRPGARGARNAGGRLPAVAGRAHVDPAGELDELVRDYRGPHAGAHARYLADTLASLGADAGERAELPAIFLAVSLEPRSAMSARSSPRFPERAWRTFSRTSAALCARGAPATSRRPSSSACGCAQTRCTRALPPYLDARPARTVEVQWLVRRAFTRASVSRRSTAWMSRRRSSSSETVPPCSRPWKPSASLDRERRRAARALPADRVGARHELAGAPRVRRAARARPACSPRLELIRSPGVAPVPIDLRVRPLSPQRPRRPARATPRTGRRRDRPRRGGGRPGALRPRLRPHADAVTCSPTWVPRAIRRCCVRR